MKDTLIREEFREYDDSHNIVFKSPQILPWKQTEQPEYQNQELMNNIYIKLWQLSDKISLGTWKYEWMGINHQQPQDPWVSPCRRKEKEAKSTWWSQEQENTKLANKGSLESTVGQYEDSGWNSELSIFPFVVQEVLSEVWKS